MPHQCIVCTIRPSGKYAQSVLDLLCWWCFLLGGLTWVRRIPGTRHSMISKVHLWTATEQYHGPSHLIRSQTSSTKTPTHETENQHLQELQKTLPSPFTNHIWDLHMACCCKWNLPQTNLACRFFPTRSCTDWQHRQHWPTLCNASGCAFGPFTQEPRPWQKPCVLIC